MSWHIPPGEDNSHIDGRTHEHHVHLVNKVTGGQHDLVIRLGVDHCPHCKRPFPKDDNGALDPEKIIEEAMAMLTENHRAVLEYAQKHSVPIKVGPLHSEVPVTHSLVQTGKGTKMLIARRRP